MTKCIMFRNPNDSSRDDLNRLWTSFSAWIEKSEIVHEYFKDEFIQYDNWNGGIYLLNIDFDEEYKIYYGESYPFLTSANRGIEIDELKDYIEIMYDRWLVPEKHYQFTVEINRLFDKFHMPYKLSSGKVIGKGYKTTENIEIILNQRMFERKIAFSEEMIMSCEILDKKCALDYIVDALQYYVSVQNAEGVDKKYSAVARTVSEDQSTKAYSVVKTEIDTLMKLSNEFFDIRHNEYLNKAKERREALEDMQFIEYLYNRAYSLLYLLRLKAKNADLISDDNE